MPTSILPAPKKAGGQEIGRSRGGLATKLHVAVDALGNPFRVILSAGQISDIDYDADHFVAKIEASGAQTVIPPRSNRLTPRPFDSHLYQARNLVERFFARLKHFRRIATC